MRAASTTALAAPGASLSNYVTSAQVGNTSTTQTVITFNDTANTQLIVPAAGGNNPQFNPPLKVAANTALTFTCSPAVSSVLAAVQAYKGA